MKVFAAPEEVKVPELLIPFDMKKHQEDQDRYIKELKEALITMGYVGSNTGKVAKFGVGDGYALYMLAEGGGKSCLIHMPLGDAYQFQYIERLTKKDILDNIAKQEKFNELFGEK